MNGEITVPLFVLPDQDLYALSSRLNRPSMPKTIGEEALVLHHLNCLLRDVHIDDAELFEKIQRAVWRKDMLDEV